MAWRPSPSADATMLLTAGFDGVLRLHDLRALSGTPLLTMTGHCRVPPGTRCSKIHHGVPPCCLPCLFPQGGRLTAIEESGGVALTPFPTPPPPPYPLPPAVFVGHGAGVASGGDKSQALSLYCADTGRCVSRGHLGHDPTGICATGGGELLLADGAGVSAFRLKWSDAVAGTSA